MDRLGVKTCAFHLGDYRRATLGPGRDVPDDYFFVNGLYTSSERGGINTDITNRFSIPIFCLTPPADFAKVQRGFIQIP